MGFENNHDGYSNIKKQARMFNTAFNQLKTQYNFNNFKGIGHSNGGLIYTYFLEHYFNERQIRIKRLMTIGSPYNFAEPDNRCTEMLSDFIKNRKNLPANLCMYSVAGSENYVEDGLVPLSSVLAGKYIYQGGWYTTIHKLLWQAGWPNIRPCHKIMKSWRWFSATFWSGRGDLDKFAHKKPPQFLRCGGLFCLHYLFSFSASSASFCAFSFFSILIKNSDRITPIPAIIASVVKIMLKACTGPNWSMILPLIE